MAEISLKIKSDFEQASADFKKLNITTEQSKKQFDALQKSLSTEGMDKFMARNKLNATAISATKGAAAGLESEYKGLQRQIESLIRKGVDPNSTSLDKLKARYSELQPQVNKTGLSFQKLNSIFIAGYNLTGGIVALFGSIGKAAIGGAANLEQTTVAFETMIGSSEKAATLIDEIRSLAQFTPYSQEGLIENSKLLLNFGASADEVAGTMSMLGDIAGGNQDKLNSLTLAFAQSSSAGRLMGQDLLQMINAGFNPLQVISQQTGKSMATLKKEMEAGSISTEMVKNAFISATSEGGRFYKMSEKSSKTLIGQFSTMKDNLVIIATTMGSKVTPIITAGLKFFNENMSLVLTTLAALTAGVIAYIVVTKTMTVVTGAMTIAQTALNAVMLLNPIGLVIAGIAALIVIGVSLYKNWEVVSAKMTSIWDGMKYYAAVGWEYIKIAALTAIKYIIEGLMTINKPFIFVIDNIIKAFNRLTGKEIPTMTQSMASFTGNLDNQIAKSSKKLEALHNSRMSQLASMAKKENEVSAQKSAIDKKAEEDANKKAAVQKAEIDYFKEGLNSMVSAEINVYAERLKLAEDFFLKKADMELSWGADTMAWQFKQASLIANNDKLNQEQKLVAMKALEDATQKHSQKVLQNQLQFGSSVLGSTSDLLTNIQTVMKNAGKESKALAIAMKALAIGQATINTALAFTKSLAAFPFPFNLVAAGITAAAGTAQVAAIASTPISAETGIQNYTVPETRGNRNDGAAVMAQGGEQVTVTPRGEESSQVTSVNISIGETQLFSIIQRGINTGQINVSNKNVGSAVFAR